MMEFLGEMLWEIVICVFGIVITFVGTKTATLLGRIFREKNFDRQILEIAKASVAAAEMIYREAGGEEKLAHAMEAAEKMLTEKGIGITKESLRVWLEAALAEWKGAFEKQ